MHVSDVGPPFARLDENVMQVEIAIILLSGLYRLHDVLDGFVKDSVVFLSEEVDGTLHPLAEVTVPEQVRGNGPVPVVVVDGMPLQLEAVVAAGAFEQV